MTNDSDNWAQWAKQRWNVLADAAVFCTGIIGTFLLQPPADVTKGSDEYWYLARFVVAIIIGLILVPIAIWNRKRHVFWWWLVTGFALVLALSGLFGYNYLVKRWTCTCLATPPLVIGTDATLTPHGRQAKADNRNADCHTLLEDNQCRAEVSWMKSSIDNHRLILAGCYILCFPLFTICIASVLQALYCLRRN